MSTHDICLYGELTKIFLQYHQIPLSVPQRLYIYSDYRNYSGSNQESFCSDLAIEIILYLAIIYMKTAFISSLLGWMLSSKKAHVIAKRLKARIKCEFDLCQHTHTYTVIFWASSWENLFYAICIQLAQISLLIHVVWSAPLLFAAQTVWYLYLQNPNSQDSS